VLVSGSHTIILPTSVGNSGRIYHIKSIGATPVTINCSGSQTIDGSASMIISSQYSSAQVVADGSNWYVI